jgi:hypothetical protein
MSITDIVFGAKAQVIVGTVFTLLALSLWCFYSFFAVPTVAVVFHISMLFGVAATYAIVATGLGFRATERVEEHITDIDVDVNTEP